MPTVPRAHGDDDQIVRIGASAMLSSRMVKGSTLKVHPGLPHDLCSGEDVTT